jgi:hypothetical protein
MLCRDLFFDGMLESEVVVVIVNNNSGARNIAGQLRPFTPKKTGHIPSKNSKRRVPKI